MKNKIIDALKQVYDPEIPVNVYDLGLIYDIRDGDDVQIDMTLTSPTCPMAEEIVQMVKQAVKIASKKNVNVNLVWTPAWDISKMSDSARLELDLTNDGW